MSWNGEFITIPPEELFDGVMWRAVTVEVGGEMEEIIGIAKHDATPEGLQAAYDKQAKEIGATSVTVEHWADDGDRREPSVCVVAHFPASIDAWHAAQAQYRQALEDPRSRRIIDRDWSNGPIDGEQFWRGAWRHYGHRSTRVPAEDGGDGHAVMEALEPGTWRLGGSGSSWMMIGDNQRHLREDYHAFMLLGWRRNWQERLDENYTRSRGEDTFRNTGNFTLLDVPGMQDKTVLKLTLMQDGKDGPVRLFVPEGCAPMPRSVLYTHYRT